MWLRYSEAQRRQVWVTFTSLPKIRPKLDKMTCNMWSISDDRQVKISNMFELKLRYKT
jgi:hypothetical protein